MACAKEDEHAEFRDHRLWRSWFDFRPRSPRGGYCGSYNRVYNAYVGLVCEQAIARLRVDTLFLSASAVQGARAYIQDQQIVRIKQAMMASAQKRILLIDHHKFERVALHALGELTEFDVVLATDGLTEDRRRTLREANVQLQIASEDDAPQSIDKR